MALKYFGTDGFRGEANVTLTSDHAYRIGRYVGWHYSKGASRKARVVVGRDTRRSGTMFEAALVAGLCASGADVFLLGVIPTPSVSLCVREEQFDCGVMITASHNPFYDNGIKLVDHLGYKMDEEILELVERYIDGEIEIGFATGEAIGVSKTWEEGRDLYLKHLKKIAAGLDLSGIKIGLDCAQGASYEMAQKVFEATGAELMCVGTCPDGLNINEGCGSTHIENLGKLVKENDLDLGFAFDGDCDRCIAVDAHGVEVNGDKLMYICGTDLARQGKLVDDMIVATVMSNMGFGKAVEAAHLKSTYTDVGDKYVCACMLEHGYSLGGEQSGHMIFSECEVTGDGIVTALMCMRACQNAHKTLTEYAAEMVEYPQLLVNVSVANKTSAMEDQSVRSVIDSVTADLNGEGRILVRPSGTEPLIRILVEAKTDEMCRQSAEKVADVIRKF